MEFNELVFELRRLVRKPPEDVVAKMNLYHLAQDTEKNGLPDKQAEQRLLDQLKAISRMIIDKEVFSTLETMRATIQKAGILA